MHATVSGTTLRAALTRIFHRTGIWLAVVAMMAIAPVLHAQVTAAVSGTVTDPKGAVVQGATVTIIDEATGTPRPAETNKEGVFSVPNLNPSTYTVKVVAQGFAPKELTGIDLHSGDAIRLPTFVLAIGQTSDTVTVTSVAGQILQTENAQRSATLTYQDVQDLALTGRDTTELLKVLPGVVIAGNTASPAGSSGSSTGFNDLSVTTGTSAIGNGMGVNGAPYKGGTAVNMDGASILDVGDDFSGLATVNPEMTQEVQVLTSNFGADTANGPVVINATGRSGGEHYHGEAYFDARNDAANANDWQDNHNGHAKAGAAYYYPGGSFSGPVPHTNKKLFFFGGMEYLYQNQGNANHVAVSIPTPEMLNGDFTTDNPDNLVMCPYGFYNNGGNTINGFTEGGWCQNPSQSPTFVNNVLTPNPSFTILPDGTIPAAYGSGNPTPTTTNGAKIPSQYIDKNMLDFSKVWPAFNSKYVATTTQQIINNGGYNYFQPIINHDNGWVAHGRIDFNWNSTNQFYISYQQSYDSQLSGGCGAAFYSTCPNNGLQYPGGGLVKKTYSKVLNGHYVHIFSPTLTNEAIASWVWGNIPILPGNDPTANFRTTLGFFAGCVYCGTTSPKYMPTFGGSQNGYPGITQPDDWEPGNYYIVQKAVPTFADNITKVWGRHTLKFGGMTSNTDNYQGNQSTNLQGSLTIGGSPTTQKNYFAQQGTCGSACGSYTGFVGSFNPVVNFLTGNLTNYAESNSSPLSDVAYQTIAFYADDSIKVNKQFTVEVGMRFEHIGWWYDRQGVGLAVFYPNLVTSDFYSGYNGGYAPGFRWHAIDSSLPLSGRPNRFLFASPRVGLSYDIFGNGKTLVRGGWGAYRYQEAANGPQAALNTAQGVKNFSATSVLPPNSSFLLSQIGGLANLAPHCLMQCSQTGQTGYDPNDYGLPLNYAYNFTIDQRLPWNMLLDIGYVGNHAQHMSDNGQDGVSTGNFANQNKIPIGSFGHVVNGVWQGNADSFAGGKIICNPENLAAPCGNTANTINSYDFTPFGRGTACTSTANPQCLIYGSNTINMVQNVDYQNYNALQAAIVKRAGPVTLNANFTWSKSLGTVTNFDPFHVAPNNTYDNENRPFVFNSSYIYREPNIWHGNRFMGGAVNGWTISGVTLWQKGPSVLPSMNVLYDPTTLPSYNASTGQQYASGSPQNPWGYSNSSSTLGIGGPTYYGTNAGITANSRPQLNCDPKSGLVKYQLYRPCFVPAAFGQPGGQGLPFIAGQAFMENDLAIYKTFTIHEQNKIQFRLSAFNWLNHPLPTFASGESTTEYYFMNYQTHAVYANDSNIGSQAAANGAPGSPINATNVYATAGEKPSDLFGQMHFKNGYGGNSQRIMEFDVKYTF